MIIRSYLNPSKACTEATSGTTGDLLLRYSASTSVLASLCPTDLPQGLPEDTEPKEGTGIRGRTRKEQGRKASADGALARESHVGVLWAHALRNQSHLLADRPQVWGDSEDTYEHWKKEERRVAAPDSGHPSPRPTSATHLGAGACTQACRSG